MRDWLSLFLVLLMLVTFLAARHRPADERLGALNLVAASIAAAVLAIRAEEVVGASVFALASALGLIVAARALRRGPGV